MGHYNRKRRNRPMDAPFQTGKPGYGGNGVRLVERGLIYGLASTDGIIRYVGLTSGPLSTRLGHHRRMARGGLRTPLYDWIREVGVDTIRGVLLEHVGDGDLHAAEQRHIAGRAGLLNSPDWRKPPMRKPASGI